MSVEDYLRLVREINPNLVALVKLEVTDSDKRLGVILLLREAGFPISEIADLAECNVRTVLRAMRHIRCHY